MSAWQDIASAPKDGASVLLLCGETIPDVQNVLVGSYVSGSMSNQLGYRELTGRGGWLVWTTDSDFYCMSVAEPTHWMPLPEPPAS